jgi:hypothetical protein
MKIRLSCKTNLCRNPGNSNGFTYFFLPLYKIFVSGHSVFATMQVTISRYHLHLLYPVHVTNKLDIGCVYHMASRVNPEKETGGANA